uniref:SWI5-dependent HO expression protein 3 n=1 Tax=Ditylenchus dipsaci TaxID=166011 RepID=A0A915E2R7_9BILA
MNTPATSLHYHNRQKRAGSSVAPTRENGSYGYKNKDFNNGSFNNEDEEPTNGRLDHSHSRNISPPPKHRHSHRKKRYQRSRSRSRSRSSSVERDSRRNSSSKYGYSWDKTHGRTVSEYEVRVHALSTQLAMAQSQIVGLENELHNIRNHASELDHRLLGSQQENHSLKSQNSEIINVMTTLKAGVESLTKEKNELLFAHEDVKVQAEAQRVDINNKEEQLARLNDRNSVLSQKCVDLLNLSNSSKQRAEASEAELDQLRPHHSALQNKLVGIEEEHRAYAIRIATFEKRENLWINEKTMLEKKVRELQASEVNYKKEIQQRVATQKQMEAEVLRSTKIELEGPQLEHLKALHSVVESLHAHHRSEMSQVKYKLQSLLNQKSKGDAKKGSTEERSTTTTRSTRNSVG